MATVGIVLLLVLRPLAPAFDMAPLAARLKALEAAGVSVAHASAYNAQYQFYGRLARPLQEIGRDGVTEWLSRHPDGRVVHYVKRMEEIERLQPEFSQRYLDGAVVLLDRESAGRLAGRAP